MCPSPSKDDLLKVDGELNNDHDTADSKSTKSPHKEMLGHIFVIAWSVLITRNYLADIDDPINALDATFFLNVAQCLALLWLLRAKDEDEELAQDPRIAKVKWALYFFYMPAVMILSISLMPVLEGAFGK